MQETIRYFVIALLVIFFASCQLAVNFDRGKIPTGVSGDELADSSVWARETTDTVAGETDDVPRKDANVPPKRRPEGDENAGLDAGSQSAVDAACGDGRSCDGKDRCTTSCKTVDANGPCTRGDGSTCVCAADSECSAEQYCNRSVGHCAPRLREGMGCDRDRQCSSNGCCNWQCIVLSRDTHCGRAGCGTVCPSSHFCLFDTCTAKGLYNAACTSDNQCISNACNSGRCGCNSDRQCAADEYCTARFLCAAKTGYDTACTLGNQCMSDICSSGHCGCRTSDECAARSQGHLCLNGDLCGCSSDADCAFGQKCDTINTHRCLL